jgi:hypothetical protein
MAKKSSAPVAAPVKARKTTTTAEPSALSPTRLRVSSLLDTRVIYCGDNLEQLGPCRTGQRNSALRTPHSAIPVAGSFYYHCDWHASHYIKVMLDQTFGENNFFAKIVPAFF